LLHEVKSSDFLQALIVKQSLISLLEICDRFVTCIAVICSQTKLYDCKTFDVLKKWLILWSSHKIWRIIIFSVKTLTVTTNKLHLFDSQIILVIATKCPEWFYSSLINVNMGLAAFTICRDIDIEFKLSIEFIWMVDWLADMLPDALFSYFSFFFEKMTGSWIIVCLSCH
jgi:hypothetical protein